MEIITEIFTVPASVAAKRRMGALLERYRWAIALPLLAIMLPGLYNWRFLIVALAIVMVVLPGILAIAYFQCSLTPDAALATVPHRIKFGKDSLAVCYYRKDSQRPIQPRVVLYSDIAKVDDSDGVRMLITLSDSSELDVPFSAFADREALVAVMRILTSRS